MRPAPSKMRRWFKNLKKHNSNKNLEENFRMRYRVTQLSELFIKNVRMFSSSALSVTQDQWRERGKVTNLFGMLVYRKLLFLSRLRSWLLDHHEFPCLSHLRCLITINTQISLEWPDNELIGCKNLRLLSYCIPYFLLYFPWYMSCQLFGNANHQDWAWWCKSYFTNIPRRNNRKTPNQVTVAATQLDPFFLSICWGKTRLNIVKRSEPVLRWNQS